MSNYHAARCIAARGPGVAVVVGLALAACGGPGTACPGEGGAGASSLRGVHPRIQIREVVNDGGAVRRGPPFVDTTSAGDADFPDPSGVVRPDRRNWGCSWGIRGAEVRFRCSVIPFGPEIVLESSGCEPRTLVLGPLSYGTREHPVVRHWEAEIGCDGAP